MKRKLTELTVRRLNKPGTIVGGLIAAPVRWPHYEISCRLKKQSLRAIGQTSSAKARRPPGNS
jgi:hypothetical protein